MRKPTILILVLILMTGCFGTFPATSKVADLNYSPDRKTTQQGLWFMLMPLYLVGIVGDIFILNPAEFWGIDLTDPPPDGD